MTVAFRVASIDALTAREMHALLALRAQTFVVEQASIYLDPDERDVASIHVMGEDQGRLVACARLVPAGMRHDVPSIGRVIVAKEHRGTGLGHALMRFCLAASREAHGDGPIALAAQAHLQHFYEAHGFVRESDPYLEDGIQHVDMRRMR